MRGWERRRHYGLEVPASALERVREHICCCSWSRVVARAKAIGGRDSFLAMQRFPCGVDSEYLANHAVTSNNPNPMGLTTLNNFPANLIITCGNFEIYYDDLANGNNDGFADLTLGATRQATRCAVLTYIQNTFQFTNWLRANIFESMLNVRIPQLIQPPAIPFLLRQPVPSMIRLLSEMV
jgi:hypothetical protein